MSITEQIECLRGKGMIVDDYQAQHWLGVVNYYRLSGYWYPFKLESEGRPQKALNAGTTFNQVVLLYEFDRKLGTLVHDAVERIEVALRAALSDVLGKHGPLAYEEAEHFRSTFNHAEWLKTARKRVHRARGRSVVVRHHDDNYEGKLPIWVLVDFLDFSDSSRLFAGLRSGDQSSIAKLLGVHPDLSALSKRQAIKVKKHHPLARWLEQLSIIRNITAHYSRLWNGSFTPVGTTALKASAPELRSLPDETSTHLYGALLMIGHILSSISPGTTWMLKVRYLIEEIFIPHTGRQVSEMGFPEGWEFEPIWN